MHDVRVIVVETLSYYHIKYIGLKKKFHIARKTVYGKCPRCRTKSQLEVISNNPGKEKFKCNICFQSFGINEM
jgi:hypothetical protein